MYDEISKKATIKYIKEKQHQVTVRYRKEEYEQFIQPVIEQSGLPVATFVKQAIAEKIEREKNGKN